MASLNSIQDIDLQPVPGKTYVNIAREWREEFIYFLMVDRFHDDANRAPEPTSGRTPGFPTQNAFYGGTIKGITSHLGYIAGLGCTAIWLSPVFENNTGCYHGYSIKDYLHIDPHFGTLEDLKELVDTAHGWTQDGNPFPIRIILDVVLNHSGNNWFYAGYGNQPNGPTYNADNFFPFGGWREANYPVPTELRNPDLYHQRGNMANYDQYPENQHGDMDDLKDYNNDDNDEGSELINILIKAHCYWIKEADIDGFRVDAIKHMGELACSRFCSNIREYAYGLGKRNFFLFGEAAVTDDEIYNRYLGQNTTRSGGIDTVYYGINSLLDFRLAQGISNDPNNVRLRDVILGVAGIQTLINRHVAQQNRALNHGESGKYLVTFVDNHDHFWQPYGRIGNGAHDEQVIAAIGFLLCNLGTPCLYYGTEQGFWGNGSDEDIREAMFDQNNVTVNCLNDGSHIYQEIGKLSAVVRRSNVIKFGRVYYREISGDSRHFGLPTGREYTLAFSRMLYGSEVLIAYNVAGYDREDYVVIDANYHQGGQTLQYLYGKEGTEKVLENDDGTVFVQLKLSAYQFVILG